MCMGGGGGADTAMPSCYASLFLFLPLGASIGVPLGLKYAKKP